MGKLIDHGWQKSAANAPQPTSLLTGANLKRSSKTRSQKQKKAKPSTKQQIAKDAQT